MKASERAYAALLDDIQSGRLQPGSVVSEVEQAARLGVSRTPLREAIGRLTAAGLVVQQSPRVSVVADIDAEEIRSLFVVRRALEETAVRLAAGAAERAVFSTLATEFARAHPAVDADAYYELIERFDEAVDAAVRNAHLVAALRNLRTHLVRVRRMARDNPQRLARSVSEHRLVARAIAAGDGDLAAHATHVHLHNALTTILESIQPESPQEAPS